MVHKADSRRVLGCWLSVLALSSRFDGPILKFITADKFRPFSTRSVESF